MAFQIFFLCVISSLALISGMASTRGIAELGAHDLPDNKTFEK